MSRYIPIAIIRIEHTYYDSFMNRNVKMCIRDRNCTNRVRMLNQTAQPSNMIIRMYVQSISFISLIKFIVRFLKRINRSISLVFHSEIKFMILEYGLYYIIPVSYTHLDVYKRQVFLHLYLH